MVEEMVTILGQDGGYPPAHDQWRYKERRPPMIVKIYEAEKQIRRRGRPPRTRGKKIGQKQRWTLTVWIIASSR